MKQAGWLRCADCRRVGAPIGAGLWARPRLQTMHAGASIIVPAAAEAFRTGGRGFTVKVRPDSSVMARSRRDATM